MDNFLVHMRGMRKGKVCPCCAENGAGKGKDKKRNTRAAKRRADRAAKKEMQEYREED